MRLISYQRCSTQDQAESGLGLAAQERAIVGYCNLYGIQIVGAERDEGASAKSLARPGLTRALSRLNAGEADGLVFAKLDRLTRSVRDLAELVAAFEKKGLALHSVGEKLDTSSASGRMIVNILGVIAAWERETIGERTKAALKELKAAGGRNGQPPWGYSYGPEPRDDKGSRSGRRPLVVNPGELETAGRAADLSRNGAALRHIARALTAEGRPTRKGGAWRAEQVRAVLRAAEGFGLAEAS